MIFKVGSALLLLAGIAFAAWPRRVSTTEGEFTDAPAAHPLSYFTASGCVDHTPNDRSTICPATRTELFPVGQIGRFAILDLYYTFDSVDRPLGVGAKSILVESSPGLFQEIYHQAQQQPDSGFDFSHIVVNGSEKIVHAGFQLGGMYQFFNDDFFAFDVNGVTLINLKPLNDAITKALPKDITIWPPTSIFDFQKGIWEVQTEPAEPKNGGFKVGCCTGVVRVKFKVREGKFVPIGAVYTLKDDQ